MPESDAVPPPRPRAPRWRPDRDLVLSLAAVVVSVCALGISVVQTLVLRDQQAVMRAQQYASVWPRLTVDLAVDNSPDSVTLTVRNAGVGPAQVAWAQATLDGEPVAGWPALVARAVPAGTQGAARSGFRSLTGAVMVAGEPVVAFRFAGTGARAIADASERVGLRVCYCSVYDQCWRLENPSVGARVPRERVTPVPACPRPAAPVL